MNNEARLEALAKRLGQQNADRLDVEATAQKVLEDLRERPTPRVTWIQQTWLRIAAALVIVVGGALAIRQILPRGVAGDHAAHLVADDLNDLSTDELRDVLSSVDEMVGSDSVLVPEANDLHELDAQQLRAVLRSLEG